MSDYSASISWPRYLIGAGVLLVLTFFMLKPDISDDLTGGPLLLFWIAHVFGALVILQSVQMVLARQSLTRSISPWLQVLASGLVGAVLFTPLAGLLDHLFGIEAMADDQTEDLPDFLFNEFTGLVGILSLVWLGLNASRLVQIKTVTALEETPASVKNPEFWNRVPKEIGRDLVALSAELHYINVHTVNGKALTLFPFGQAVEQLADVVDGLQIHRSHWVALSHVERVKRKGQGGICYMRSGLELPVSRRHIKELESALKIRG